MSNLLPKILFCLLFLTIIIFGFFPVANSQYSNSPSLNILGQTPNSTADFFVDWSAKTFVPSDYIGKPLPTFKSVVSLSATPIDANKTTESNYIFYWTLDNATSISNPSKNNIASFEVDQGSNSKHKIHLRIFDKNNNLVKEHYLTIPVVDFNFNLYQVDNNGSLGVVLESVFSKTDSRVDLIAKPFFFSNIKNESDLKYTWKLNNQEIIGETSNPSTLSLTIPKETPPGTQYQLKLLIENPLNKYQSLEKNYKIVIIP